MAIAIANGACATAMAIEFEVPVIDGAAVSVPVMVWPAAIFRLDARRVLAAGLAIWGAATALTGLPGGFLMVLLLRMIVGLGESVMCPASFKMLACDSSEESAPSLAVDRGIYDGRSGMR